MKTPMQKGKTRGINAAIPCRICSLMSIYFTCYRLSLTEGQNSASPA